MKKLSALFFSVLIALSFSFTGLEDAEAKRFGGARSFGGKPSYYKPYRKPSGSNQRSAQQQQAERQNQAARQQLNRRGGLIGLLGGLALGGLLGSLFFGGAFQGLNFMDILVFGGLAWLLYKMFAAKPRQQTNTYSYSQNDYDQPSSFNYSEKHSQAGFDTDILFKQKRDAESEHERHELADADFNDISIPKTFNQDEFFTRRQSGIQTIANSLGRQRSC